METYNNLTKEQIKSLLNPYCSSENLIKEWKKIISEFGKDATQTEINRLALFLQKKYHVSPLTITALLIRPPIIKEIETEKEKHIYINKIKTMPPNLSFFHQAFAFKDEEGILSLLEKKIYPKDNETSYGPTNNDCFGDHITDNWCHLEEKGQFHGMFTCECFENIPDDSFFCESCKEDISWKEIDLENDEKVIRIPVPEGGWKGFYCSLACAQNNGITFSSLEEAILEISNSIMFYNED